MRSSREGGAPDDPPAVGALDKKHLWHPFTPMAAWCAPEHEPLIIVSGQGCVLRDAAGREYLDGNSSIWTNIHGHGHPHITEAIIEQARRVAHTSFLGLSHPPAVELAAALARLLEPQGLSRVFFSDDGSTAVECAVRMALQFWRQNSHPEKTGLAAFSRSYHGDTLGAACLGGIATFRAGESDAGYAVTRVGELDDLRALDPADIGTLAAVVIEPLVQGAAGMQLWPRGMLKDLELWCRQNDIFLILDEVLTGFGRTGTLFACQQEQVRPDFIALAKGLTGGYLPLAATVTTERVFEGFLQQSGEDRTFYYGHSYTANALGCAAALASLRVFREEQVLERLPAKCDRLRQELDAFKGLPWVAGVRQCGLIAAIDLVENREPVTPYPPERRMGEAVCLAARAHGLLTRPIRDTLVLMPPLAATEEEISRMARALRLALIEVCGS